MLVTDTLLHILLGVVLFNAFNALALLLGPALASGMTAAFWLYTREVTQAQAKHFDCDFRKGWDFWNWSRAKNIETWIPVGAVLGVAMAIRFGVQ